MMPASTRLLCDVYLIGGGCLEKTWVSWIGLLRKVTERMDGMI